MGRFFFLDGKSEHADHDAGRRERFGPDDGAVGQRQFSGRDRVAGRAKRGDTVAAAGRVHQRPGLGAVLQEVGHEGGIRPDRGRGRQSDRARRLQESAADPGVTGVDETERVFLHVVHHHQLSRLGRHQVGWVHHRTAASPDMVRFLARFRTSHRVSANPVYARVPLSFSSIDCIP